ncbi:DHHC palmitoyltransferase [Giardia muris]|uniref:Palmitoyltransferase n=1 Tax=Giardia muris TaxID=5742 RepID=A0A4Z1TD26_GIAMU|nr:DHHC palmitoyltransferase [Giardia muris]|eukprot:TNJ30421.1 DHHC palmitoyltransferase [Giardia muris]
MRSSSTPEEAIEALLALPELERDVLLARSWSVGEVQSLIRRLDCTEILDYVLLKGLGALEGEKFGPRCQNVLRVRGRYTRPRKSFRTVLGPILILVYLALHISLVHVHQTIHLVFLLVLLFLAGATRATAGYYPSILSGDELALMQVPREYCEKCRLPMRPGSALREKQVHCRYCDVCIDAFDHHCFWLGCCISRYNYWRFFGTLCWTLLTIIVGLVDSAYYYRLMERIPIMVRIGLAVQFVAYITAFLTLLVHVNKLRSSESARLHAPIAPYLIINAQ